MSTSVITVSDHKSGRGHIVEALLLLLDPARPSNRGDAGRLAHVGELGICHRAQQKGGHICTQNHACLACNDIHNASGRTSTKLARTHDTITGI